MFTLNLSWNKAALIALSVFGVSACGGSSGSSGTKEKTYKSEYAFTAWRGANDSTIDIDGSLPDGAELYSYRNSGCDIANITACTEGHSLLLNNQTITDQALTATDTAYYKVKYQSKTTETKVPDSTNASAVFSGRYIHQAVAFKGKLWVIGGRDGSNRKNDVWSSADGITWTQVLAHNAAVSNTQFSAREGHQAVAFKDKLWVIGGMDDANERGAKDVWSSEDGITWTQKTANAAFSTRYGHRAVVFNDALWVIGGSYGNHKNDVWSSTDGITWTEKTTSGDVFSAREDHQVVAFNNKLWVIGGDDGSRKDDVYSSEDGSDWTKVTEHALFTPRSSHQAVAFDNKLWVIGGQDGSGYKNDVWSSADGITWGKATASAAFTARYSHQAVAFKDKLWVIGGDGGGYKNDAWASSDRGKTWRKGYVGKLKMP